MNTYIHKYVHINACKKCTSVCILCTRRSHLDPCLGQPQPLTQLLTHERVRVVRLVKQAFQLVELLQREVGPAAALLQLGRVLVLRVAVLL